MAGQQQPQLDIATAYFSVRGFELVRATLPGVRHFRLLLGDNPQDAAAIGAQPNSRAYLRNELNAEPLTAATQRLVEELIRFLRRDAVEVRLYLGHAPTAEGRHAFLHAKCYLLYGGRGDQQALFDYLNPLVGIVGSSNFTAPGLLYNRELNLVHKTLLEPDESRRSGARAAKWSITSNCNRTRASRPTTNCCSRARSAPAPSSTWPAGSMRAGRKRSTSRPS